MCTMSSTLDDSVANCHRCRHAMKLVRVIPKIGIHPALLIFLCPNCNEVETLEAA